MLFTSTRETLEEQLFLKNVDNATSLALVLTQSEKSPTTIELLMAAKFDSGHYSKITLVDENQSVINEITFDDDSFLEAPSWFVEFAKFNVKEGVAQVSEGWSVFGTLHLESQTAFAINMLWDKCRYYMLLIVVLFFVVGVIGTGCLHVILKPLNRIVNQANSFSERRFITIAKPWTSDFARVVRAMNSLADRFKTIVIENNKRLEEARFRSQYDQVTGLPNINAFFSILESQLRYRDKDGQNALIVHSLGVKGGVDVQSYLKEDFNSVFAQFAAMLTRFYAKNEQLYTDVRLARVNETEVMVLLTDIQDFATFQKAVEGYFSKLNYDDSFISALKVDIAGVYLDTMEASYSLMERVDELLEFAQKGDQPINCLFSSERAVERQFDTDAGWMKTIDKVIDSATFFLSPVTDAHETVIHNQALMQLEYEGQPRNVSYFADIMRRVNKLVDLDVHFIELALEYLEKHTDVSLAILLFGETMQPESHGRIRQLFKANPQACKRLIIEFRESNVVTHLDIFSEFCVIAHEFDVKLGLKRVGDSFSKVLNVHEFGLSHIKVDSAFVYDIVNNQANQLYLRGLADLAHALGLQVIGDGVVKDKDESVLFDIGFDAVGRLNVEE